MPPRYARRGSRRVARSPGYAATLASVVRVGPVGAAIVGTVSAFSLRRGPTPMQRAFNGGMYALSGYAFLIDDMSIFRENIQYFFDATSADGVVPENIDIVQQRSENREAWDAMPNLINATYTYAAKTGDRVRRSHSMPQAL